MKLSSISLVVTAIAAIAGSAIAAPGPAHARALDAINSFDERDVDVNRRESGLALLEREIDNEVVDNLFTRGFGTAALEHEKAAKAWETIGQTAGHFISPWQANTDRIKMPLAMDNSRMRRRTNKPTWLVLASRKPGLPE